VCVVYAGVRGFLDKMVTSEIYKFEQKFLSHLKSNHPNLLSQIRESGEISQAVDNELKTVIEQFIPECGCQMKV